MNIENIQALIAQGLVTDVASIDPNKTYISVGVYQPGNRPSGSGNNTYPSYVITIGDLLAAGGNYTASNGITLVGNDFQLASNLVSQFTNDAGYLTSGSISGMITGTLTTNYIPKATAPNILGDSLVFDNGAFVGVNSATQFNTEKLRVGGAFLADDYIVSKNANGYVSVNEPVTGNPYIGIYANSSNPYLQSFGNPLQINPLGNDVVFPHSGTKVGIGTTPLYPLHVKVGTNENTLLRSYDSGFGSMVTFQTVNDASSAVTPINFVSSTYYFTGYQANMWIGDAFGANPTARVHIKGTDDLSTSFGLKVQNSSGSAIMVYTNDGNLGISEPTPTARLSILTPDNLSTSYGVKVRQNVTGDDLFYIKGNGDSAFTSKTRLSIGDLPSATTRLNIQGQNGAAASDNILISYNYGASLIALIVKESTNVGIGKQNQTPTARLHVEGIDATSSNYALKVDNSATTSLLQVLNNGSFQVGKAYNSGYNNTNFIDFISPSAFSTQQRFSIGFDSKIYANIDPSNTIAGGAMHVGSGGTYQYYTNANFGRVEVNNFDTTKSLGWIYDNPSGTDYLLSIIKTDNSARIVTIDQVSGNFGIGTSAVKPTSKLQVVGLPAYVDNTAATGAGLTAGAMYIRTGHGLDIVV